MALRRIDVVKTRAGFESLAPASVSALGQDQRVARISRKAFGFRQPELLAHDIRAKHHGDHLVGRVPPAHAFASHSAIRRDDQSFGWNVFQRLADQVCDPIWTLDLQRVMIDHANNDLLVLDHFADFMQVAGAKLSNPARVFTTSILRRAIVVRVCTPPWPRGGYRPRPCFGPCVGAGACLFDHLVGAQQNRREYGKIERLGSLEVHDHLELARECTGRSPDFAPRRMRLT